MKLRITSDLHTEFMGHGNSAKITRILERALPVLPHDARTTLVIAGDLGSMHKPDNLIIALEYLCSRFVDVIYIPGNHEYYGGSLKDTPTWIADNTDHIDNLLFGPIQMHLGKPTIHANTLWTDFDGGNDVSMFMALRGMNDYNHCGGPDDGIMLNPEHTLAIHRRTVEHLHNVVNEGDIVITHHLPSFKSIDSAYTNSPLNGAYASDLEWLILHTKPSLWIHGHTHRSKDYMIGQTRVLCNPRGYEGDLNPGYNPELVVEV